MTLIRSKVQSCPLIKTNGVDVRNHILHNLLINVFVQRLQITELSCPKVILVIVLFYFPPVYPGRLPIIGLIETEIFIILFLTHGDESRQPLHMLVNSCIVNLSRILVNDHER